MKLLFTLILAASALVVAYGLAAFFVFGNWWPNDPFSGRLPCLYLIVGGLAGLLVGAAGRSYDRKSP